MKGLSFSEPMVKAWLEGRKTVTRRLMNPQPEHSVEEIHGVWCEQWDVERGDGYVDQDARPLRCRYLPGETVYIKETWAPVGEIARKAIELAKKWPYGAVSLPEYNGPEVIYKADWDAEGKKYINKWKSPRFMPEWASRSHARIVSVRPERVQEITVHEVALEGCLGGGVIQGNEFQNIWESLHPGTWDQNPWVWRIELEKVKP